MKNYSLILIVISLIFINAKSNAQNNLDQCFSCHISIGDKQAELFTRDIHYRKGISCAGCHGGNSKSEDMEIAMSKNQGFIGVPKGDKISEICSSCHSSSDEMAKYNSSLKTDQLEKIKISSHGKLTIKGDRRITQCTTCHNSHWIQKVNHPESPVYALNIVKTCSSCHSDKLLMKQYDPSLSTDQASEYFTSVHGKLNKNGDIKTAECVSCHGSHDILPADDVRSKVYLKNLPLTCAKCHSDNEYMKPYNIATNQFEDYSNSVHGIGLLKKGDVAAPSCNSCHGNHGAMPPGLESISKVCGNCHVLNADLFSKSPHKKAFDEQKIPECEICHGKHKIVVATNKLIGTSPEAVCVKCHSAEKNSKGYVVASNMKQLIDSLLTKEQIAIDLVNEAEQKGMEISDAKFKLRDVRQVRLETRTVVHAFDMEKFAEVINRGIELASEIEAEGTDAIDEFYFRRWGLLFASLFITILAITIFIYIRRIDKKKGNNM